MHEKKKAQEDVYQDASREVPVKDETDYKDTTRGEVQVDATGWKGVSRGVVHRDQPNAASTDAEDSAAPAVEDHRR